MLKKNAYRNNGETIRFEGVISETIIKNGMTRFFVKILNGSDELGFRTGDRRILRFNYDLDECYRMEKEEEMPPMFITAYYEECKDNSDYNGFLTHIIGKRFFFTYSAVRVRGTKSEYRIKFSKAEALDFIDVSYFQPNSPGRFMASSWRMEDIRSIKIGSSLTLKKVNEYYDSANKESEYDDFEIPIRVNDSVSRMLM